MKEKEALLYAFDIKTFCLFFLLFYLIPYPIYRLIAHHFQWETNPKSASRHWSDLFDGLSYGLLLFTFGNYANTLSWITVTAFYPSLFGYALIAELPFTKTSLPNIKHWPKGMWVVFLIALSVILVFASCHIYLGSLLPPPFLLYYVSGLCVPISILMSSFALSTEVNTNWIRTRLSGWRNQTSGETIHLLTNSVHNPYSSKIAIHLHHWQIFYTLAFFTRFDHPVSQVGAGIVLACYMEGICAYGFDRLVNDGE